MTLYFVQTDHRHAGPTLHRHLAGRYRCYRLSSQTHLVDTEDPPAAVADGLTAAAGPPRSVESLIGPTLDWTLLVAALAGPWAGALGAAAPRWVGRLLSPPGRPRRPAVLVAHWDSTDGERWGRPDGYFRYRFRDWASPSCNKFVLRTRLGADALWAGIRNKWRGARRGPNVREVAFVGELAGPYAAYLSAGVTEWLEGKLGPRSRQDTDARRGAAGRRAVGVRQPAR